MRTPPEANPLRRSSRRLSRWVGALLLCTLASAGAAAADGVSESLIRVERYAVQGDNPLSPDETARLLAPYLGERVGIDRLEAAAEALDREIRARGYAFHRVTVPPQTPSEGVITLAIVRFTVGTVSVTGNRYFDEANIRASVPALVTGEAPHGPAVARQLAMANENPSKRAALVMRAGARGDTVDAELKVDDGSPQLAYFALNNTGRSETGDYRAAVAYQHNNLFGRDQSITLSFITSPDHFDDVKQYGVNYVVPFYALGGSLSAFYTRSDVNSGRIADFFDVSGSGEFAGVRYTHNLLKAGTYAHKIVVGVENHAFNNNVDSVLAPGVPLGTDVGSRPLTLRYQGKWDATWGNAGFFLEYARNLGGGSGNSDAAYAANRSGATTRWDLLRVGFDASRAIAGNWLAAARMRGQASGNELIPGEQFGLGGVYSVRGFHERETAGDSGYQLNLELWTPAIGGNLRPLVFVDGGERRFRNAPAGQSASESLSSVGGGLRWQWQSRLEVSLDAARVLDGVTGGTSRGSSRLHFGLVYRF